DKVFVRSVSGLDVATVVGNAKEFFNLFLSNWVRWDKEAPPAQRGAWVRLYGIPLHAWNVNFFKLCVFDCGRFLRADSCAMDKVRLDYARVLIATSSLEVIKKRKNLLVDGILVQIQIVEEWGYDLGDDACLEEVDGVEEDAVYDKDAEYDDLEASQQVDMLVDKIVRGMEEDVSGAPQSNVVLDHQHSRPLSPVHKADRPPNMVLKQHSGRPEEERPLDVFGEWMSPLKEGQHKP
ncbi:sulfate transporter, partial [Trifolium medium]|nr:sulfate transporter [Trifolium medium]